MKIFPVDSEGYMDVVEEIIGMSNDGSVILDTEAG